MQEFDSNDKAPALSLILCSRNDQYMGNSRWRLETALNYLAQKVYAMGRESDVEVVVTDWGSPTPLDQVLKLSQQAASLVSFVYVPPSIARELQRDSPFPEVLALNAAARRAKGTYIGRIDQDTLVGKRFLGFLFELANGKQIGVAREKTPMFANQRMVPYRFTSQSPSLASVDRFIDRFGSHLTMEHRNPRSPFYTAGVGIWLLHRDLWHDCEGYDEKMIYMNGMETNMVRRLQLKYELVNLGRLVDYDFYHLEHYHPYSIRKSSTHRKVNPKFPYSQPEELRPNGDEWGLNAYPLEIRRCENATASIQSAGRFSYIASLIQTAVFTGFDEIRNSYLLWKGRAAIILVLLLSSSPFHWPRVLRDRWQRRKVDRMTQPAE